MIPSKDKFCSSPWMHMRLTYDGRYEYCRWANRAQMRVESNTTIREMGLVEFFNSAGMCSFRKSLLDGTQQSLCQNCYYEDKFDKTNGRRKQLFRNKIDVHNFDETFNNSPDKALFEYSEVNNGQTLALPFDFQVDLSDLCNSACIMCWPGASTKLHSDYTKLSKINSKLFPLDNRKIPWVDDPVLVQKFINGLLQMPKLDYLHLLGGETLVIDSFYDICRGLIKGGRANEVILGTTTNCTVWVDELEDFIREFSRGFHLGLSIESAEPINDYIRYPSKIDNNLAVIKKFLEMRNKYPSLFINFRITPNIFTINYLDTLIQFMYDNQVIAEACNILSYPSQLRMELLPDDLRQRAISKLEAVAARNGLEPCEKVIDTRNPELWKSVLSNVVNDYIIFLKTFKAPVNPEQERLNLVSFISAFEQLRKNSILDYAPEYEQFLCSYGYKRFLNAY